MMTCALSGNSCSISASAKLLFNKSHLKKRQFLQYSPRIRASGDEAEDCNAEECAPDKEVGKVSMEWLAGEKTQVVGTFPPRKKGWTGYVEKDTAGQTNIYSVEPAVYIAESAISSGTAGSSSDGSENTAAVVAGIALISIAAASSVLFQVGKTPPVVQTVDYAGPSLSYYINKFTPPATIEVSAPPVTEGSTPLQTETSSPEVPAPPVTEGSTPLQTETSSPEVSAPPVTEGSTPLQTETSSPEVSASPVTEGSTPLQTETSSPEVSLPEVLANSQQESTPDGINVS